MKKILIIDGPNLNMIGKNAIGQTEPENTYEELQRCVRTEAQKRNLQADHFQTNFEGEIIEKLQKAVGGEYCGVIINPSSYAHYSYAIYDALLLLNIPKIEVHMANLYNRENFRAVSVTAPACDKLINGRGFTGYSDAIDEIIRMNERLEKKAEQ